MQLQQSATFNKTLSILNVLANQGAKYCIQMPDGTTYGNLTVPTDSPKKKKFSTLRKHGAVSAHITPYLANLAEGQVAVIPDPMLPDLDSNQFQSAICAKCHALWGSGSYTALKCNAGVEVLRLK
jgi:ribosomal protein L40E